MCKLCEELQFIDLEESNLELQLDHKPGTNNMCIWSLCRQDDHLGVAELKINYRPLCGRSLNED